MDEHLRGVYDEAEPLGREHMRPSAAEGARRLVAGFALIIAVGTVLLRLPISSATPGAVSWLDAFFTATSAVTVTGLTVESTAETYSLFGQSMILLLLQVGGVGFISLSVVLFRIAGRRVTLQERFLLRQVLGREEATNITRFTLYVLGFVVAAELVGAALLFVRWLPTMSAGRAAYLALFHAVSAFCNAGFDLYSGTGDSVLFGYGRDPYTLGVLALLIIIGGFGIVVMDDVIRFPRDRRLSTHTRISLVAAGLLTALGLLIVFLENQLAGGPLARLAPADQIAVELFTVISARTAGITIFPLELASPGSQLILMLWMFIGGAPSSMAGGVSTSTVGVIAVAMLATVSGQRQAVAFNRALPIETILKAVAVMTVSTLLVLIATMALVLLGRGELFVLAFEVVSAFSNTGYSLGVTGTLGVPGRLLLALLMFWGRLGPLTLVVILAQRQHPSRVTYPDEHIILG